MCNYYHFPNSQNQHLEDSHTLQHALILMHKYSRIKFQLKSVSQSRPMQQECCHVNSEFWWFESRTWVSGISNFTVHSFPFALFSNSELFAKYINWWNSLRYHSINESQFIFWTYVELDIFMSFLTYLISISECLIQLGSFV